MEKKRVLGLDLGTNSIGWALVNYTVGIDDDNYRPSEIVNLGSRIIPMDAATLSDFNNGILKSQTSERTQYRGVRRLRERHLLRRERLLRVLNILGFLPEHYSKYIDFAKNPGKFLSETEPKITYHENRETGKPDFYYKQSFAEMLQDFAVHQPELVKDGKKVPYDWTIYYLRKKALTQKIAKEELAWLILNFNQKRGYYEQRGEDEDINEAKEYQVIKVAKVEASDDKKGDAIWYNIHLENGDIYRKLSRQPLDWEGRGKEFIVTFKVDRDGNEKRSYSIPTVDDWTLVKKRTEKQLDNSLKTVGAYIYDTLLENPNQKIKGKLIQTIERKFYRKELYLILEKQKEFHAELCDVKLYKRCIEDLYRSNEAYRNSIQARDFIYLFIDNIIFYHRPLKSKKSLIDNCQYEYRIFKNPATSDKEREYIKCMSKSHPLFEEFRLWQFLKNVTIIKNEDGRDVTASFLSDEESYVALFDRLKEKKEVDQKGFLSSIKGAKLKEADYSWNYGGRKLPMCPTHAEFISRLKRSGVDESFLSESIEEHLWHILYSVNDKMELKQALQTFAVKYGVADVALFVEKFGKMKPFEKDYASYSAKAIKKLLALMRMGRYWHENLICDKMRERINKFIDGENCAQINNAVRERVAKELGSELSINSFKGLPLWLACYVVYNRHSEASEAAKWESPEDVDAFLTAFKQHSLRNPIVEQVVTETLRVVRDVWAKYGSLSEIHIELGREMRNPVDKRRKITAQNIENENTNLRIKALLLELKNEGNNVRPESMSQQERLKIYEEGVLGSDIPIPDDIIRITHQKQPSHSEIIRYKCWLEQGYCSPYTGKPISLGKLFTSDYEIEHIIPQARYFDNSFSNKVICESAVNKDKGNMLACEYIRQKGGSKIELGNGKQASVLSFDEYENFVKRNFKNAFLKKKKMLMDEIPDSFIERQMNDTRYISRYIKGLLSNIVREEGEQEATSKKIISITGAVTAKLKEDWGMNDVWHKIVTPRFLRLNELSGTNNYGYWVDKYTFKALVPENNQRGFSKKRIDHRHHAMDALVLACTTRLHVNYLNNLSAKTETSDNEERKRRQIDQRFRMKSVLCSKTEQGRWLFNKPWDTFVQNAQAALANTIISFKQNLRVINKSTNKYQRYENGVKKLCRQTCGDNWAIRKPLHTPMPYGKIICQFEILKISDNLGKFNCIIDENVRGKVGEILKQFDNKMTNTKNFLRNNPITDIRGNTVITTAFKINVEKYRKRQPISKLSDRGQTGIKTLEKMVDFINKIVDIRLRQDLFDHLEQNNNDIDIAFSSEGIERFNSGRIKPVYRLPIAEKGVGRFQIGNRIGSKHKWGEAEKGTNLFFAVYETEEGKRVFETIPLNVAIDNLKQGKAVAASDSEKKLLFTLSPNDLVYLPTKDQLERGNIDVKDVEENKDRIYKFVSCTGNEGHFIPYYIASPIVPTTELGSNNKAQRAWTEEMIKEVCVKLKISRLGDVIGLN